MQCPGRGLLFPLMLGKGGIAGYNDEKHTFGGICMNILALYSSPKKRSNSSFLLDTILQEAEKSGRHSIEKLDVARMELKPCLACKTCFHNGTGECVQKDDHPILMEAYRKADYIFMSTPLYWWYVSAQLKLVIDRLYPPPYDHIKGKTVHLVMTGESPTTDVGYKVVEESFRSIFSFVGADFKHFFVSATDSKIPSWENEAAIREARRIGAEL